MYSVPYLRTDWLGSKRLLRDFILKTIDGVKFNTVVDAFSGSSFVAHLFKKMGKEVYTNDFFNYPYLTAKTFVENSTKFNIEKTLFNFSDFKSDLDILYSQSLKTNKIQSIFKQQFYTEEENNFYELIRQNCELIENPALKNFFITCLCRIALRRIEHGKYTHGMNLHYRVKYGVNLPPINEHFEDEVRRCNKFIFDNNKTNKAFNRNIVKWKDMPNADLVYFDPPYGGHVDYEATYHFIEGLTTLWHNWSDKLHCKNLRMKTGKDHFFSHKDKVFKSFEAMFKNANHIPQLLISSNDEQSPNADEIISMIKSEGYGKINMFSKRHKYLQQSQGFKTDHPKVVNEILILAKK